MTEKKIIGWLLEGDVSVQYQAYRDLLGIEKTGLRKKIEREGWGFQLLTCRGKYGHWGLRFYQPKWTSTHYTLLDLKNLNIAPGNKLINETLRAVFRHEKGSDGCILPIGAKQRCDVCVNGMVLNYAAYFKVPENELIPLIDYLLAETMPDGGFNCRFHTTGAVHSSLHTTLSVLEGILEFKRNGYTYRIEELEQAKKDAEAFILAHRLFRSDKTGEIINPNFLKLCYPGRWYYDILKAMDYFQLAQVNYDERMKDAIEEIMKQRTQDGLWKLPSKHPGQTHFEMEQAGKPSRWNTLRALRVLKQYNHKID